MIEIESLVDADKGRLVTYHPGHGGTEAGVISSWNDKFIFVRYTSGSTAAATDPTDLTWQFTDRNEEHREVDDFYARRGQRVRR